MRATTRAGSRTCRRSSAAAAALQAVVAERDEENVRRRALVGRIRRVVGAMADVEVVGDPDRSAAPPGHVLLPVRRRRGARDRARPAGVRGGERLGVHGVDTGAQPRARRHGRAHPRQRPGLRRTRHHRGRRRAVPRACSRVSSSACGRGSDARARLPRPGLPGAGHRAGTPHRRRARSAISWASLATDAAARVDVPAWCRMTGHEYVGEEAAADGASRLRRTPDSLSGARVSRGGRRRRLRPRRRTPCGPARRTAPRVKVYSCVPTVSTTYAASTQPTCAARSWPKPHSSPARNPARKASPTPVGSTAVTPGAALTSIGSAFAGQDPHTIGAERGDLGADALEDLLGRPAGLGLDHVRLVLVGEQVRRAVDEVADQVAIAERELLARVGDEREPALPALAGVPESSPRGRRRRSARSRARPPAATIGASSISRASLIAPG